MFNLDKRRAVAMPDGLQAAYQADAGHRAQLAEKTAKPRAEGLPGSPTPKGRS
jgi:hypothetical protein